MLGLILQARTGSTRLPNKILLPFYKNKPILETLLERLINAFPNNPIILATSKSNSDDVIESLGKRMNIKVFRGSEDDVLKRFIDAASENGIDQIVRICSDNPFLDIEGINVLINYFNYTKADYVSFKIDNTPVIKSHFGLWTECVSLETLKRVHKLTSEKIYREHVTNYVYAHPELFDVKLLDIPEYIKKNEGIRLTVDTEDDFLIAKNLYKNLNGNLNIINLITEINKSSDIIQKMKDIIKNNSK